MTSNSIDQMTIHELLMTHSKVLNELKVRGVIRSKNNPTGDYAEWLVSNKFGLALEANSAKGFDAADSDGARYQIKGRRVTPDNPSTQLGVIRNLVDHDFDFLIAVIFQQDWEVLRAAKIPYAQVEALSTFRKHQNGHIMHLRPSIFDETGVEDITAQLID